MLKIWSDITLLSDNNNGLFRFDESTCTEWPGIRLLKSEQYSHEFVHNVDRETLASMVILKSFHSISLYSFVISKSLLQELRTESYNSICLFMDTIEKCLTYLSKSSNLLAIRLITYILARHIYAEVIYEVLWYIISGNLKSIAQLLLVDWKLPKHSYHSTQRMPDVLERVKERANGEYGYWHLRGTEA